MPVNRSLPLCFWFSTFYFLQETTFAPWAFSLKSLKGSQGAEMRFVAVVRHGNRRTRPEVYREEPILRNRGYRKKKINNDISHYRG
ncbi:hypothetical protein AMJ85_00080 [candidate division BRC1 bacterium SM23_51]|nr:MAG: hypothetical protein AMJ85_00080 [candidate division BRC1 bacterium SM23_51]